MKRGKKQKRTVPPIPLSPNDLKAIDDILTGYIQYLRHNTLVTSKTQQKIQRLERIHKRVSFVLHGGEGVATMITELDIEVICDAMFAFVRIIRRTVPQSSNRDETLKLVNLLRQHLEKNIFP